MEREAHILIVEDDHNLALGLGSTLRASRFQVTWAKSATEALDHIRQGIRPDLFISDVMMENVDGFGLRTKLAENPDTCHVPFIYLSARTDVASRIYGLSLGADDYITKPFDVAELIARIRAVLRRAWLSETDTPSPTATITNDSLVRSQHLALDSESGELKLPQGDKLFLTRTEKDIMSVLMSDPGHPFTTAELVRYALGYAADESAKSSVTTHISNIRRKLRSATSDQYIHSKRSWGYYVD